MISIIVCSKYSKLDAHFIENIKKTVGIDYELIAIDNSKSSYSIFEAYNLGVERAKGEFLCFVHEDVVFYSQNWGAIVQQLLSHEEIGLLGIAGSHFQHTQVDWRFYGAISYLIQGDSSIEPHPVYSIIHWGNPSKILTQGLEQVAVVDGVWMCIRRELFSSIHFDNISFHGFHLYDSDISMQVHQLGKNVFITNLVMLEHQSAGFYTEDFRKDFQIFAQKWNQHLPIIKGFSGYKPNMELQQSIDQGVKKMDQHIIVDVKKIKIKELLHQKNNGIPCRDFTKEEYIIMDQTAYFIRKAIIKNKRINAKNVRKIIIDYWHLPFAKHRIKLIFKYIWYRIFK